jgi:hypothetical protein
VSDADFALKSALKKKEKILPASKWEPFLRSRTHIGVVSAVCSAPVSGRVFLGFVDGTIACFDPFYDAPIPCVTGGTQGSIISLTTDDRGHRLIALCKNPAQDTDLISLIWSGTDFRLHQRRAGPATGSAWLTPIAEENGYRVLGVWEGDSLAVLWCEGLLPWGRNEIGKLDAAGTALLFLTHDDYMGVPVPRTSGCLFCGDVAWYFDSVGRNEGKVLHFGWRPGSQLRGLCSAPPLSRLWRDPEHLEIAGVDEDDSVHWTELAYGRPEGVVLSGGASNAEWKYVAAALIRPGLVAGVTREGIVWLHRNGHRLRTGGIMSMTMVSLKTSVACAVSLPARELLVICREGTVVRVPLPN